jgi:hypothetical protein
MSRFVLQQRGPRGQLVPSHRRNKLNLASVIAEAGGLIESKLVDGNDLGRRAKRDAIPAEQARNLQIPRRGHEAYQDQIRISKWHVCLEHSVVRPPMVA